MQQEQSMFGIGGRKQKLEMGSPEANEATRRALAALGDDGGRVRKVTHYAAAGPKADAKQRRDMIDDLVSKGYKPGLAEDGKAMTLEQETAVTAAAFDQKTGELAAWFKVRGWSYDGWECVVASREAAA